MPPWWLAGAASTAAHTEPPATASALGLLETAIGAAGRRVTASMRVTVAALPSATQTPPSPAAIAPGSRPTRVRPVTASVVGSICETVASWRLTIHTAFAPTATPTGPFPTAIGFSTSPERGSMRNTVPPSSLATHTPRAPAAIAVGMDARPIRFFTPVARSTRVIVGSTWDAIHSDPKPAAMAPGALPTLMPPTTRLLTGLTCQTRACCWSVTHSEPAANATPTGLSPATIGTMRP